MSPLAVSLHDEQKRRKLPCTEGTKHRAQPCCYTGSLSQRPHQFFKIQLTLGDQNSSLCEMEPHSPDCLPQSPSAILGTKHLAFEPVGNLVNSYTNNDNVW